MAMKYARMASVDRIPFNTLAKSVDIKKGLVAQGFKPWNSHTTIQKEVHNFAVEVKAEIKEDLHKKVQMGVRFSVTTDEYTSLKIDRHCCVNIHESDGKHTAIGMIKVKGTFSAEKAAEILTDKIGEFDIQDSHLIANTTDGASVMKKMGRLLDRMHQLCHAHGKSMAGYN